MNMAETTKATARQARASSKGVVFNANHNTNEKVRAEQPHIDVERMKENLYFECSRKGGLIAYNGGNGGFNSTITEKQRYIEIYGKGLEARNERYKQEGHSDRCRTMQSFLKDPKTAPLESIYQIGNVHSDIPREKLSEALRQAFNEFYGAIRKQYKDNLIPLDIALHMDEATPHIHFRYTLAAQDKYGFVVPNQNAALEQMGIDRPDPSKPKSRYNNPLISFSDQTRELFYQCCEHQGLTIDREVQSTSRRQEEIHQFKFQKMREDIARLEQQLTEKEQRTQQAEEQLAAAISQTQETTQKLGQTEAALVQAKNHFQALNDDLAVIEQTRQQLKEEVTKLTYKNNAAKIEQHNLSVSLEKLQAAIQAAQKRSQEAQAAAQGIVEKLAALEQHARGEYDAYDNKTIKKYEEIPKKEEKRNIFGKVTQEASPRMYLVNADQLDKAEAALGHVWVNQYNNRRIQEIEKKLDESEIIQELEQQIQDKQIEINRLTGLSNQQQRTIEQQKQTIQAQEELIKDNGLVEELQKQQHTQHRGIHH